MFARMCDFMFVVRGSDVMLQEECGVVGMGSWSEKFGIGALCALKANIKAYLVYH